MIILSSLKKWAVKKALACILQLLVSQQEGRAFRNTNKKQKALTVRLFA